MVIARLAGLRRDRETLSKLGKRAAVREKTSNFKLKTRRILHTGYSDDFLLVYIKRDLILLRTHTHALCSCLCIISTCYSQQYYCAERGRERIGEGREKERRKEALETDSLQWFLAIALEASNIWQRVCFYFYLCVQLRSKSICIGEK